MARDWLHIVLDWMDGLPEDTTMRSERLTHLILTADEWLWIEAQIEARGWPLNAHTYIRLVHELRDRRPTVQ